MIETALHNDINQPTVIENFAKTVSTRSRLDLLYLISYAELMAVAPGTWTSWKKVLLSELYHRSYDYFKQPESLHSRSLTTWLEVYKILHWEFPPEDLEFHFNNMPEDYLETVKAEEAALHIRLIRSLKNKPLILNHSYNEEGKVYQVILCLPKKIDAFKKVVGVLTAQNMNILEAKIYLRKDEIIIISINIEETERLSVDNLEIWKNINHELKEVFENKKDLLTLLAGRTRYISEKIITGNITPKIQINNKGDQNFSVIRIEARDHLGMLYKISKIFADTGIHIHSAKIATQGGIGIDVFYVSLENKKISSNKLVSLIKKKMKSAMLLENPGDLD